MSDIRTDLPITSLPETRHRVAADSGCVSGPYVDTAAVQAHLFRRRFYGRLKRVLDVIIVLVALPAALLVIAAASAAIVACMGRPILFFQERVGANGGIFRMIKLRTMTMVDRKSDHATLRKDPRITPLGSFLRRTHIDELPQLWNVLAGDMTLIGPRAEQPHLVAKYRAMIPNYDLRHCVTPGLSGWAQVNYGYAADTEETRRKTDYDLYYVCHFGPMLDLSILAKTLKVYMDPTFVR